MPILYNSSLMPFFSSFYDWNNVGWTAAISIASANFTSTQLPVLLHSQHQGTLPIHGVDIEPFWDEAFGESLRKLVVDSEGKVDSPSFAHRAVCLAENLLTSPNSQNWQLCKAKRRCTSWAHPWGKMRMTVLKWSNEHHDLHLTLQLV